MYPKKFVDENHTLFTKGPFEFNGIKYDYRLKDKDGEDYCTQQQMKWWSISVTKIIER